MKINPICLLFAFLGIIYTKVSALKCYNCTQLSMSFKDPSVRNKPESKLICDESNKDHIIVSGDGVTSSCITIKITSTMDGSKIELTDRDMMAKGSCKDFVLDTTFEKDDGIEHNLECDECSTDLCNAPKGHGFELELEIPVRNTGHGHQTSFINKVILFILLYIINIKNKIY